MFYYTTKEIHEKYRIEKKTLYHRCRLNNIPKIEEGNRVYYNHVLIDKYFADLAEEINPDLYYTPEQMMERCGMSRFSVVSFAMRHSIHRLNRHHDVYYSRAHVDAIKEKLTKLNPDYYTYADGLWPCAVLARPYRNGEKRRLRPMRELLQRGRGDGEIRADTR